MAIVRGHGRVNPTAPRGVRQGAACPGAVAGTMDHRAESRAVPRLSLSPLHSGRCVAVTTDGPIDHPHHQSVWIGADHVYCRLPYATDAFEDATYNFYVGETFQGRAPGRIISVGLESTELAADHLRITQTLEWQGPEEWGRAAAAYHRHRDEDTRHPHRAGRSLPGHPLTPAAYRVGTSVSVLPATPIWGYGLPRACA